MRLRRVVFAVAVTAAMIQGVVGAAPSGAAPEKIFSLNVPASVAAGGTGVSYPITFKNETPSGNSTIKSLTASVTPGLTITNATAPSGTVTWTATSVSVANVSPIKNGRTFVVTLTVDVASDCSSSATWTPSAWTGTSFNSDTFRLLTDSHSQLVTQLGGTCQLQFVPGHTPSGAIQSQTITASDGSAVQVELLQGGNVATWFTGTITINVTSGPSGGTLSGNAVAASAGVATFSALSADTVGDYVVDATALGLTSDAASFTVYTDGIFCGQTVSSSSDDGTSVDLTRTDVGGGSCNDIPYTLTVSHNLVSFLKDQSLVASQGATFEVVITWPNVGNYPGFGTTMVDIDGDGPIAPFVPNNCTVVGGVAQYPINPDGGGNFWPNGTAEQPWCIAAVDVHPSPGGTGMDETETFLGAGDPVWTR